MKVVFPSKLLITSQDLKKIQRIAELTKYDDIPSEDEIIKRIEGAELITSSFFRVTRKIISSSPSLKYIIVPTVGYDWVDMQAINDAGIKLINCPTHNGRAVAEYTIAMMFAIARKVSLTHSRLIHGFWDVGDFSNVELGGKIMGLIGYGNIGKQTAQLARCLGMVVLHADSSSSPQEIDDLIARSDFLCLNLTLTQLSTHLVDDRRMKLMKRTAFIINTARGAVIDQDALTEALKNKTIAGAALDVFENEPLLGEPSSKILDLASLENVIATPHVAFCTQETLIRLGSELIQNIEHCISGKLINVVNKD